MLKLGFISNYFSRLFVNRYCNQLNRLQQQMRQKKTRSFRESNRVEALEAKVLLVVPVISGVGASTTVNIEEDAWNHPLFNPNANRDLDQLLYGENNTLVYADGNPLYFGAIVEDPLDPGVFVKFPVPIRTFITTSGTSGGQTNIWDITSNDNADGDGSQAFSILTEGDRYARRTGTDAFGRPIWTIETVQEDQVALIVNDHTDYGSDGASDVFSGLRNFYDSSTNPLDFFTSSVFDQFDDLNDNLDVDGDIFLGTDSDDGGDFNFEAGSSLSVTLRVRNQGNLNETDSVTVNVNLLDINDAPFIPVDFDSNANGGQGVNVFYVPEDVRQGDFVGDLVVYDEDNNPKTLQTENEAAKDDPIQLYEIVQSPQINGVDVFVINPNNGEISINSEIDPNLSVATALLADFFDYENPDSANNTSALNFQFINFYRFIEDDVQDDFFIPLKVRATDFRNLSDPGTDGRFNLRSRDTFIYIGISDVSEFEPVIPEDQLTLSVNENTPSNNVTNRLIGTITPTDGDRDQFYTFAIDPNTNPNNAFRIVPLVDPVTGLAKSAEIRVNNASAINFEAVRTFSLGITVTDVGLNPRSTNATISINVNDLNEATTLPNRTFLLDENTDADALVGTVTFTDIDVLSSNIVLQILDGNEATVLIDAANITQFQDLIDAVQLSVPAADQIVLALGDTVRFQNIFELDAATGDIHVASSTGLTGILVNDVDEIGTSPSSGLFDLTQIDPSDFLDFELNPLFNLSIRATDVGNANPSFSSDEATITIQLVNLAESGPDIPENQVFTIPENRPNNTSVGTVQGIPGDDVDSSIRFSIIGGNTNNTFAINQTTGELTVNNTTGLNFEANPFFDLVVEVRDPNFQDLFDTAVVRVNLTNVNERPTITANQSFNVFEQSPVNTVVGTVAVVEPDANQTQTFSISSGNIGSTFALNPTTGQITVANNALLDAESANQQFNLVIRVNDNGVPQLSHSQTVRINLLSVNEPPVVNAVGPFTIPENSPVNTFVGQATFTDVDVVDAHTWAIVGGDPNGIFAIAPTTGNITVIKPQFLDFETAGPFVITVEVTDSGNLTAQGNITINLSDVNELPEISLANTLTEIRDIANLSARRKVADIVVTDDALGSEVFSLSGPDAALFEIIGTELFIKAGTVLNATANPVLNVNVNVNDPTIGTAIDDTAPLAINVIASVLDVEPNNTPEQAIMLGTGTFQTTRFGQVHRTNDRIDFYKFTIPAGEAGDVTIDLSEVSANVAISLFQLNGNSVGQRVAVSNRLSVLDENITLAGLAAGDYLLEVKMIFGEAANTSSFYQLDVDVVSELVPIDREPDNRPVDGTNLGILEQSTPINAEFASLLNRTTDDRDYYTFTLAADHIGSGEIKLTRNTTDVAISLYRTVNGVNVERVAVASRLGVLQETLIFDNLAPGEYAVEIRVNFAVAANTATIYEVSFDLNAINFTDNEPNNTLQDAVDLGIASMNSPINRLLGGQIAEANDSIDFYKFAIAEGEQGTLDLSIEDIAENVVLFLLDANGQVIEFTNNTPALGDAIQLTNLAAGEYFVAVQMQQPAQAAATTNYRLNVDVTTQRVVDVEDNNLPSRAIDLGVAPLDLTQFGSLDRLTDRIDYYTFTINPALTADVNILLSELSVNTALSLFEFNNGVWGNRLQLSNTPGLANELISIQDLAAGTYLIEAKINFEVPSGQTFYRLDVDLTITTPNEPNNTFADAVFVGEANAFFPVSQTFNGNIGNIGDPFDYFRFTVADGVLGSIRIDLSQLTQNVNIIIYDETQFNVIAFAFNAGTANENIQFAGLTAGEYFIELSFPGILGNPTDYLLQVDLDGIIDPNLA